MYVHQVLTPNGDATELGLYRFFGSCIKVFHVHVYTLLCLSFFLFFLPVSPSLFHFIQKKIYLLLRYPLFFHTASNNQQHPEL